MAETPIDEIRAAMRSNNWRAESVLTFTHGIGVQVYTARPPSKRWTKVGPLLFPHEGGTVADTLTMLASLAAPALSVPTPEEQR